MIDVLRRPRFLIPLLIFMAVAGFFAVGLKLDSNLVPSPLIGKTAPQTRLPVLNDPSIRFSSDKMAGEIWLLNVWASWCVACREEHETLMHMQREGFTIVGLNYKDKPDDAKRWLADWGDPYVLTAVDEKGEEAIDWGVYGVPETFVIDAGGTIRYKHIGPLSDEDVENVIRPLLQGSS